MELDLSSVNWWSVVSLSSGLLLLLISLAKARNGSSKKKNLPPGPPGWPVLGNMFDLGMLPHRTMCSLRSKYGPVMWLRLGSVNTMVVQSSAAAAELFKKHDLPFSDRKVPDALTALNFNEGSVAMSNYGGHWRVLRKLATVGFLDNSRMHETVGIRRRIMDNMVEWIDEEAASSRARGGKGEVQVSRFLNLMTFNIVGNLMLSRDLLDPTDPNGLEFFNCMNTFTELIGTPNIADFLPFSKWMDPFRIKKNTVKCMMQPMEVISKFVQERLQEKQSSKSKKKNDFLDTMLEYRGDGKEGPDRITENNMIFSFMEMFFAGSEATSTTIEWGFAELLRNPDVMRKVREEIDSIVGNRKAEESDMDNLPYLTAVVKETFRLYPIAPLLLPRNSMEDTTYMGYDIPKGTQVFVNAWAIGRDPDSWVDPLVFKPERFLNSNIGYRGQDYELIPFGSGRRFCVGFALGHRVVHLALATLVQSFEWENDAGFDPKTMDMEETLGITLRKKIAVKAIPRKRIGIH